MSFIHTGSIEVRTANGLLQFTGTSHDYAVTGWVTTEPKQDPQLRIPAQRAGNAYDTAVLNTDGGAAR